MHHSRPHQPPPQKSPTPTTLQIIKKNVFTLFNTINFLLALAVILVGSPQNALFFGVALMNTLMGIFQELRAKRTLDHLAILARGPVTILKNQKPEQIDQSALALDDILLLRAGNQVVADATITSTDFLEVDESLLTGESTPVKKSPGSPLLSGSFILAGQAHARVTALGKDSYAGQLTSRAKRLKKPTAPLMRTLQNIIKYLAILILPVGIFLFYRQLTGSHHLETSVLGATAAMVGIIPEGLVLLTGITLTLGALKLARKKALVQSLPSIETLARIDTLCLDKTGTITDGTLAFEKIIPLPSGKSTPQKAQIQKILAALISATKDDNETARALRTAFPDPPAWHLAALSPFSSDRKWSGAAFADHGSYLLGAPQAVLRDLTKSHPDLSAKISALAQKGHRVLLLTHSNHPLKTTQIPKQTTPLALIVLSDHIRPEAIDTFAFFAREGVAIKVISGDDAQTVSAIATKVGIKNAASYINLSALSTSDLDFDLLVETYTVFGRVRPEQKKSLIAALKAQNHTVCMTGDGVNDVLALKEADCGVAMISGSDAARASADFVLMTDNFSAMVDVLKEGRRVINNIENVATLYLVKSIYSVLLALLFAFIPAPYPFSPLQMTPGNALAVGIPSFFLAFRHLYHPPRDRFLANILKNSLPAAIIIVASILTLRLLGSLLHLPEISISTMNTIIVAAISFTLLHKISRGGTKLFKITLPLLILAFLICLTIFADFFGYAPLLH